MALLRLLWYVVVAELGKPAEKCVVDLSLQPRTTRVVSDLASPSFFP